jgi:hypothetical protein
MEYVLIAFYIFATIVVNTGVALMIDSLLDLALRTSYKQKYRRYLLIPGIPLIVLFIGIPVALFIFVKMVVLDLSLIHI